MQQVLAADKKYSFLVNHFAECEKRNLEFTDPEYPWEILLRRNTFNFCQQEEEQQKYGVYYVVNGGQIAIERIIKLDPKFFVFLSDYSFLSQQDKGLDQQDKGLDLLGINYQMASSDLCLKMTEDIMPRISIDTKKGHVWGGGSHLLAIGKLNDEPFKKRVGRYSNAYKQINKPDSKLDIETLYIGDKEKPKRTVIYSKKKEVMKKGKSVSTINTHIEMRMNFIANPEYYNANFFRMLFIDYFGPAASYHRSFLMLNHLYNNMVITTKQRVSAKDPKLFHSCIADWWKDSVISPLQDLCDLHIEELRKQLHNDRRNCLHPNSNPIYHKVNFDIKTSQAKCQKNKSDHYSWNFHCPLDNWYSYYRVIEGQEVRIPQFAHLISEKMQYCINRITKGKPLAHYRKLRKLWLSKISLPQETYPLLYV